MIEIAIQKQLGSFTLDARLEAPDSGVTALFGRSGMGKTSVINALAGLMRPDRGRIVVGDTTLFDSERRIDLPPEKRRLGYVFQEARLFPHYSVRGNLLYGAKSDGAKDHAGPSFDAVVDLLGIKDLLTRRPADLSGGEKQRVAIGRALLASPRLLLMDEPLASLDEPRKNEIMPFIERLRDELKLPIFYVSHEMEEIIRLADLLVLLDAGKVAASGSVEDLTSRLDLWPLTGRYEAGAVIRTVLRGHDTTFGFSELAFPGGRSARDAAGAAARHADPRPYPRARCRAGDGAAGASLDPQCFRRQGGRARAAARSAGRSQARYRQRQRAGDALGAHHAARLPGIAARARQADLRPGEDGRARPPLLRPLRERRSRDRLTATWAARNAHKFILQIVPHRH